MIGPVVFLGPSAPRETFARFGDLDIRPPAAQGDVYRAVAAGARVIGLVDGVFESIRSVWHKEILYALDRGVTVLGAASMGALRAAELAPFGMRGIGRVFEAFASGELEDDDEVALIHAPARLAFRPLSEAMVNVRWTAARAAWEGVVEPASAEALIGAAKALFYPDRDWPKILREAALRPDEDEALSRWLPAGRIDVKREDALALGRALADASARGAGGTPFQFEPTALSERARRAAEHEDTTVSRVGSRGALLVEEVRLVDPGWPDVEARALAEVLATFRAVQLGLPLDEDALATAVAGFRTDNRLEDADAVEHWLAARQLEVRRLLETLAREVRLGQAGSDFAALAAVAAQDRAWLRADAPALMARAVDKRARLERARDAGASPPCDLDDDALLRRAGTQDPGRLEVLREERRYLLLLAREDGGSGVHEDLT